MFHCEGFTGEEGFEESVPWPISEGRAGGEALLHGGGGDLLCLEGNAMAQQ